MGFYHKFNLFINRGSLKWICLKCHFKVVLKANGWLKKMRSHESFTDANFDVFAIYFLQH